MSTTPSRLRPGTLLRQLTERTAHALRSGALQPIATERRMLRDAGVDFVIHMAPGLPRKQAAGLTQPYRKQTQPPPSDPFLSPEEDLTVTRVSDTHLGVLNKFSVIDNHLLIVTSDYEAQECLLTLQDFEALWTCLRDFDGLGFYNSGPGAGSSQPHKHLQLVPLPLPGSGPPTPIEPLIATAGTTDAIAPLPAIPYHHSFSPLAPWLEADPREAASETLARYRSMLAHIGVQPLGSGAMKLASAPYNLLMTRRWMLLVPRRREHFSNLSVNALGFAGSLLVRDDMQLDVLIRHGPMQILQEISAPSHPVGTPSRWL